MRLPPKDAKIKYVDEGQQSGQPPLRELHLIALSIVSGRDGVLNESNTPQSWEACGEILVAHFKKAEDVFAKLEEALKRPYDQYPYAWNDGMEMNYPHLAKLRQFTQIAVMRSMAFSAMARSSASFRDAQLAISLIHTGDSDLVTSRLLQMAQAKRFKHVEGGATVPRLERRTMVGGSGPISRDGFPGSDSGFDKGRSHLLSDRMA